ncbi:MAG: hypothetical protein LBU34_08205 [Planctomycetaceae bacterium]|nr:hypothetical protein [Planctomycetaceae bacterium]
MTQKKPFILSNLTQIANNLYLFSRSDNSSPVLRLTIHKVGNRSPSGFHPTIASVLADLRLCGRGEKSFASTLRRFGEGFSPTAAYLVILLMYPTYCPTLWILRAFVLFFS